MNETLLATYLITALTYKLITLRETVTPGKVGSSLLVIFSTGGFLGLTVPESVNSYVQVTILVIYGGELAGLYTGRLFDWLRVRHDQRGKHAVHPRPRKPESIRVFTERN